MQKLLRSALLFSGCVLLGMSAGAALSLLIVYLIGNIREINQLPKLIQQLSQLPDGWYVLISVLAISHLCSYLIPALIYWYSFEHATWKSFQTKALSAVSGLWAGLISVIVIQPFIDLLIDWNQHLKLPRALGAVEEWMYRKEQENILVTNQLVALDSVGQLIAALFVSAFIASIGEEVFFRGIIQRKLAEWTMNVHIAIWLAAILFSAAHFQFYGFFPRLLLGALFGYLYYWSGNLWVPISAHFINNGLIVITAYSQRQPAFGEIGLRLDTTTWPWIAFSIIGVISLLIYFYRVNQSVRSTMY
ncbi:CPBP family intramembrane metalloprotease [Spirosoma sp. HMF4905]|uniref:CPBP family intramembrane metalloprotease n=1 Tax=Spirosoma arboris TaxID=2682092 RepID=A0A7K1S915_9BACT|nr:CPBP family intramembrane glutamic endopeptidase [Spirosoma arboris]MVM30312.1 CPBP family intramembrane metalloprotease [Spirosoma arboris]